MRHSNNKVDIYIDHKLDISGTITGGNVHNSNLFYVGNDRENRHFDGIIDNIKIFKFAFPPTELLSIIFFFLIKFFKYLSFKKVNKYHTVEFYCLYFLKIDTDMLLKNTAGNK